MRLSPLSPALLAAPLLAAALCGTAGAQETKPFSVEDLVRLERVAEPQVSPDGRYVAFSVRETDIDANKGRMDLWLIDLSSVDRKPRRLTQNAANDSSPRWTSDSRSIYFLSTRSGSSQVWRLGLGGGEAMQVTALDVDVGSFKVSPAGNRLALSMEVFVDCPDLACTAKRAGEKDKAVAKGMVFDQLFVRHWDTWDSGQRSHLFVVSLDADGKASGAPLDLSRALDADVPSKPFGGDEEFNFSPDGKTVAFNARIRGKTEPWSTNFDVYEAGVEGGTPRNLTGDNPAWDAQPTYSPDGRYLAWLAMDRAGFEADRFHLVVRDQRSGDVRHLTKDWDRSIASFSFSSNGRRIFATADHVGQHPLFAIDVQTGKTEQYVTEGYVGEFSVGSRSIIYSKASLAGPADLYSVGVGGGRSQQLTQFNAELLGKRQMGAFEQFSFPGWNGETVYGFAMQPANFEPGKKYPLAFIVHGGPQSSFSNAWSYRWNPQVYAGAGYGVVFIDFHGSPGYGQAFTDSISGDWGGKPLEDLQKGLAAALEKYQWLDGSRACALGASYGGFMINWIAGNWPDRFRCLVNHDGIFDARGMYYQTEELWFEEWENGGPQYEKPENYEKHNPVNFVKNWRTPMLVVQGGLDFRVPDGQGLSTFTALQRRGIESKLLYFPNENHWVLKPANSLQWHKEVLGWLEKWTK